MDNMVSNFESLAPPVTGIPHFFNANQLLRLDSFVVEHNPPHRDGSENDSKHMAMANTKPAGHKMSAQFGVWWHGQVYCYFLENGQGFSQGWIGTV